MPEVLSPGYRLSEVPFLGVSLDGRLLCYYLLFAVALVLFLAMLRIVNSPFGELCPVSTQLEISHTRDVREKSAYDRSMNGLARSRGSLAWASW